MQSAAWCFEEEASNQNPLRNLSWAMLKGSRRRISDKAGELLGGGFCLVKRLQGLVQQLCQSLHLQSRVSSGRNSCPCFRSRATACDYEWWWNVGCWEIIWAFGQHSILTSENFTHICLKWSVSELPLQFSFCKIQAIFWSAIVGFIAWCEVHQQ